MKAQHVLLGIFSLLMIATSSLNVVSLPITAATTTTKTSTTVAPPPYPACDKVPSYSLVWAKGQFIDMYGPKSQKVNGKNATVWRDNYRAGDAKSSWSKWSVETQNGFLNRTIEYLFIDGKPVSIKTDICYDKDGKFYQKIRDTVYKVFYLVIPAGTYTGKHYFFIVGFWNGQYDTHTGKYSTITFT
jgi:hypothetical protein